MSEVLIREARPSDSISIAQVHVETWQNSYLGLIPDSYLRNLSIEERTLIWDSILEKPQFNSNTLIAEINGVVLGFVNVGPYRDLENSEAINPTTEGQEVKKVGEILAIYVDRDNQGFGIGSRLLNGGLDFLKRENFATVALWVLAGNNSSRHWYESRGWRSDGKIKSEHRGDFDLIEVRYILNL